MSNYKMTIAYDGTDFSGVAEQITKPGDPTIRTVVGELRPVIEMVAQAQAQINVSGRTDKGVHARDQVLSFNFPDGNSIDFDCDRMAYVCNKKLNPEIVVKEIDAVDSGFHARHSAKSRTYRYFIDCNKYPSIYSSRFSWHVGQELDISQMEIAAKHFLGEQDFTSVCKIDESMPHNIREVFSVGFAMQNQGIEPNREMLCFEICANAFCWNMVRSIVGVLVDVGSGKITPDDVAQLLSRKQRDSSRTFAPAKGLTLWSIEY